MLPWRNRVRKCRGSTFRSVNGSHGGFIGSCATWYLLFQHAAALIPALTLLPRQRDWYWAAPDPDCATACNVSGVARKTPRIEDYTCAEIPSGFDRYDCDCDEYVCGTIDCSCLTLRIPRSMRIVYDLCFTDILYYRRSM
jgi:hypothetical protein